jgi:tRNA-Thr(GGU) m(6)t(6)A37 methyltransferase TsaA
MQVEPIGHIESCFKQKFAIPRQSGIVKGAQARLVFRKGLPIAEMLDGIERYSHIWLIWVFHQNTNKTLKTKIQPPKMEGTRLGVFATRTPHRPNPIGLSAVRLLGVEDNVLILDEVDVLDGTPILDIKPYIARFDSLPNATAQLDEVRTLDQISVDISEEFVHKFRELSARQPLSEKEFLDSVCAIVQEDPRPIVYKNKGYKDFYRFQYYDLDVTFSLENGRALLVDLNPL